MALESVGDELGLKGVGEKEIRGEVSFDDSFNEGEEVSLGMVAREGEDVLGLGSGEGAVETGLLVGEVAEVVPFPPRR